MSRVSLFQEANAVNINFKKSISVRFVAILILVLAVGQGVGAYLFLSTTKKGFMDSLHDRMKREVKQYAGILAEPIQNYNSAIIESLVKELLKDEALSSIKILDNTGNPIKEGSVNRGKRQTYVLKEPIVFYGETIGTIIFEYSEKTIDDSMKKSGVLIPIYQLGMLLIVALVLIRLFHFNVKRPVEELNNAISDITGGDLSVEVPVMSDDEIGTIANGVKFLAERLSGTVDRTNSNSAKLTRAVQKLNDSFDRVRQVVNNQNHSTEEVARSVKNAAESQQQIVSNTEELLALSGDNLSSLLEMHANSGEIAAATDDLNKNLQDAYSTLAELAQSAKEVAGIAHDGVGFISEASSSVEEVYRSVRDVESSIKETARLSIQTTNVISDKGLVAITDLTDGMKRIGQFIDSLMQTIEKLGSRSRDIGRMLAVMEEVTAQSRLLSLNAQIIAAQAGANGKGFAVVAEEMRQLADTTSNSTQEIDSIVGVILHEIDQVVSEVRESVAVVREGETVVKKTANVLDEIMDSSRQATDLVKKIERAAMEQTEGLRHVVNSTEQVRDKIYEVNRATNEQEKSTAFLLKALDPIKEAMMVTKRGTEEQVKSTRFISNNIELANQKNSDIAKASSSQHQINQRVLEALEAVKGMGNTTVSEVEGLIPVVSAMLEDMNALRSDMAGFRTAKSGASKGGEEANETL